MKTKGGCESVKSGLKDWAEWAGLQNGLPGCYWTHKQSKNGQKQIQTQEIELQHESRIKDEPSLAQTKPYTNNRILKSIQNL